MHFFSLLHSTSFSPQSHPPTQCNLVIVSSHLLVNYLPPALFRSLFQSCPTPWSCDALVWSHDPQVSVIAKHEFAQGLWAELNQFILLNCNNQDPRQREVRGRGGECAVELEKLVGNLIDCLAVKLLSTRFKSTMIVRVNVHVMIPYRMVKSTNINFLVISMSDNVSRHYN